MKRQEIFFLFDKIQYLTINQRHRHWIQDGELITFSVLASLFYLLVRYEECLKDITASLFGAILA